MGEAQAIRKKAAELKAVYEKELFESVIPYWMNSDLIDRQFGGYLTSVDREGRCYNTDKSVWFQGRGVWTFSALCRCYGIRNEWKEAANIGKEFMEKHCVDSDGRMFFQVTREGKPLRKRRYFYSEGFYVLSMAEYGACFGDKEAIQKAADCFDMMLGIYRDPQTDPFKITPKMYEETRKQRSVADLMVLVSCAQVMRRCQPKRTEYYNQIIKTIADDMIKYHFHSNMRCLLETVAEDGSFIDNPTGRTVNPGHSCENAWFLMNEAIVSNDKKLLEKAIEILDCAIEKGWDEEHGGIIYFADAKNIQCEQLEWDMKLWWVHNEALIATLMAYGLTGDTKWWNWFVKIHDYTFARFPDREFGEWYGYLHRTGTVSHTTKGSMWKGPFHLPRCLMICDELLSDIINGTPIKPVL